MFNSTLIRKLRQTPLNLADGTREEHQPDHPNKLNRVFNYFQSFVAIKHHRRADVVRQVAEVLALKAKYANYDDAQLNQQFYTSLQQAKHSAPTHSHSYLAQSMACVGEAIFRTFGFYPHDVQYLGAKVLLDGQLAEMQTGEGKTIVAAIAATVAAGSGAAVHVLSTNEYLANRDQEEMQVLFDFFDISSGAIDSEMEPEQRHEVYYRQICYVSASELVFDILKDELNVLSKSSKNKVSLNRMLQSTSGQTGSQNLVPALHFCIVDEADSVLIDEASTPLIISEESDSVIEASILQWALEEAKKLQENKHFMIDWANRDVILHKQHIDLHPPPQTAKPMWQSLAWQYLMVKKALNAIYLFELDEHYIIKEDKIVIVDESTGRPMPDRSWEQGLHQLIEMKEGLEVSKTRHTIAQMTFQRFFKRYILLSGLTGTAAEVSREMWHVYGLKVQVIPPNKTNLRKKLPSLCTLSPAQKWQLVATHTLSIAKRGQPVLIGTRSVEASEQVWQALQNMDTRGLNIHILNARQDEQEAQIVAQAGQSGTITIATNMAGRGTDIKLDERATLAGGLHVVFTEHHDSKRIDRQLIGRTARQGNAGSFQEIVCIQDDLLTANKSIWQKLGCLWSLPTWNVFFYNRALKVAQRRSQNRQYEIRMNTLKQDKTRQKQIGFIGNLKS